MSNELVIEDIQLGDGKEVVKGALITTQYNGLSKMAASSTHPMIAAKPSSA